jgi:hypothetical protein
MRLARPRLPSCRPCAARRALRLLPAFLALGPLSAALVLGLLPGIATAAERSASLLARGPQAAEGPFTYDQAHDLGALWREALDAGWGEEDAVVLLERHEVTWTSDGRRIEVRHRVVRLATDLAVEHYADLRVPYDSLRSTLTVLALRTFRDGEWIESGATAQVEMTPFGLDRAPDYAWQRERMLMHDGVEVPCVVETAWRIEDVAPFRRGIWGLEVLRQADPVVRAEITLYSSLGAMRGEGRNGAGEGERLDDAPPGLAGRRWRMERLDPVADLGADPGADLPCVAWSSWTDWAGLGAELSGRFAGECAFTQAHRDTLRARLRGAGCETERARRVATLVADKTRLLETPEAWWGPPPRPASATYETAYGTKLDRAVLAAGLFREAGLAAEPCFAGRSFAPPAPGPPGLDRFGPLRLLVRGGAPGEDALLGLYDPSASSFTAGLAGLAGRVVWRPSRPGEPPAAMAAGAAARSLPAGRVSLALDLHRDAEAKAWVGTGTYSAAGALCPFGRMEGLGEQSREFLGSAVSAALEKAEVTAHNPSVFEDGEVIAGFALKAAFPEPDKRERDRGRGRLSLGGLEPSVASLLPGGLALHRADIDRVVFLPGPVEQELRVRLVLPEAETIRLPEPMEFENLAGRFYLRVERDGDAVTITRGLSLSASALPPSAWPELRALLLAEEHDRNRVVVYKSEEDEED